MPEFYKKGRNDAFTHIPTLFALSPLNPENLRVPCVFANKTKERGLFDLKWIFAQSVTPPLLPVW